MKDYIDYTIVSSRKLDFLAPYFEKYGLQHAPPLPQDIQDAYQDWRSYVGIKAWANLPPKIFAYLLSDYSLNHPFKFTEFDAFSATSPVDIKLQFVVLHAAYGSQQLPEKLDFIQDRLRFNHLAMFEQLFKTYGVVGYQEWMPKKAGPMWTLFKADLVTDDLLDAAFNKLNLNLGIEYTMASILMHFESLVDVFYTAFQKNRPWF